MCWYLIKNPQASGSPCNLRPSCILPIEIHGLPTVLIVNAFEPYFPSYKKTEENNKLHIREDKNFKKDNYWELREFTSENSTEMKIPSEKENRGE